MLELSDDYFNLAAIVRSVAEEHPDRPAIIHATRYTGMSVRSQTYTYRELSDHAESLAPGLRELGIAEGTRIVYMAPPSIEAAAITVALNRVGATLIMIDPSVGYRNVGERLRRLKPEAMVGSPLAHLGRLVFGWGPRFMKKAICVDGDMLGIVSASKLRRDIPEEIGEPAVSSDDIAAILYTTGSTGPAKPAVYSQRNYSHVHQQAHRGWGLHERDEVPVDLLAFPAFMPIALSAGGTCVIPPVDFARLGPAEVSPEMLKAVINEFGVRTFFASPALLGNLARYCNRFDHKLPSLIRVVGGGAPLFPPLMSSLVDVMGEGAEACANYGATEALPSTQLSSDEVLEPGSGLTEPGKGVCVGRPFPGITMRVVRHVDGEMDDGQAAVELRPGQIGELLVSGPNISQRYYEEPHSDAKNKVSERGGRVWHRLGDNGYRDEQGRYWVVGRTGHIVRSVNGELYPMLAETIVDTHPYVFRSGLVGVPGGGDYETPVICVQLRGDLQVTDQTALKAELLDMLKDNPKTQGVEHLLFSPGLPLDPRHNAKIERPKLAKWAAKQM